MSRLLYRTGGWAAAHPWRMVAGWLSVLMAVLALSAAVGGRFHDDYTISGTESQSATELLRDRFPAMSGADARVVVHDRSGHRLDAAALSALRARLADVPHASGVTPPRMSADGDTALITVQYDVPVTDLSGATGVDALRTATAATERAGLEVELGGQVAENQSAPGGTAEMVGVLVALVIMLVAFGSVVAAGLPLAVAFVGLGIGTGLMALLAAVTDVSTSAPTVAEMVGIGVGIDYALLLVTRHVEGLRHGLPVVEAAAESVATAGQSVVFAGSTVLVSLMGLRLSGLPVYASFGLTTGLVVAVMVLSAVTLVPALCGLAGRRILGRRERRGLPPRRTTRAAGAPSATARWAARVGRRPLPYALGALAVLVTLAAPLLGMRTWPQDAGSQPESNTVRRAYDLVSAEYGPGANGPFVVAVDLRSTTASTLPALVRQIAEHPGVATVTPPVVSPAGDAAVLSVESDWGPQDERSSRLVDELRAELPAAAQVTGWVAVFHDIVDLLDARLWLVVAFVVGVSLVLLTVVFRSVVVPVKAALVNLLSVGAAYGVLTAVFQWGWGAGVLGLPHAVPVSTWVPILLFAVLFGLSMDYEVFLLSRIREHYLATGDAKGSVVSGLASTGRVITSAALIMIAVFTGFGLDSDVTVKMIGVGMAAAILIDATIVRMVLVPAAMALLGKANWWMPRSLERLVPHIDVHGSRIAATAHAMAHQEEAVPAR
jgi:RND superfamily putative drug exporter